MNYKQYIYYAIQLPCDPNNDFNVAFDDKDRIVSAMEWNYGIKFHLEDRGVDVYGEPVTYVVTESGSAYARIVKILL